MFTSDSRNFPGAQDLKGELKFEDTIVDVVVSIWFELIGEAFGGESNVALPD